MEPVDGLWSGSPSRQICNRKSDGFVVRSLRSFDIHQSDHLRSNLSSSPFRIRMMMWNLWLMANLFDIHQSDHSPVIIWDQIYPLPLLELEWWYWNLLCCLIRSKFINLIIPLLRCPVNISAQFAYVGMMRWTLLCCLIRSTCINAIIPQPPSHHFRHTFPQSDDDVLIMLENQSKKTCRSILAVEDIDRPNLWAGK